MSIDIHHQTYKEEAFELLSGLENILLKLEEHPHNKSIIEEAFRVMHTIKGSGSMFGFEDIASFMHRMETVYDYVRNGKIPITKKLINLSLSARDHVINLLENTDKEGQNYREKENELLRDLGSLIPNEEQEKKYEDKNKRKEIIEEEIIYKIYFCPCSTIFLNGTNPLNLIKELQLMGECNVIAHVENIPLLSDYNTDHCYTYWDITLKTFNDIDTIKDVFIFIEDYARLSIEIINQKDNCPDDDHIIKKSKNEITIEPVYKKRIGEILVEKGIVTEYDLNSALEEQQTGIKGKSSPDDNLSSIRVSSEKLDKLMDLVGEIVITQARFSQTADKIYNLEIKGIAEEMERLIGELRTNTLDIRLVPIGTIFSKFKRLIRDLSGELNKDVDFITEGGETEIDKSIIDKLGDPLLHLLRNSMDHGIEIPEKRIIRGKPEKGKIKLSAFNSGSNVIIEIKDDGKGLDKDTILKKAVEKNIISPDKEINEKEIFNLIFAPGFSTATEVTNVSGRGVGMDVVKRSMENLGGSIELYSNQDEGTTVRLKLPLTLAIIEGLLTVAGDEYFVFPLSIVEESLLLEENSKKSDKKHIINVRGKIIPYICLKDIFNITSKETSTHQVVITSSEGNKIGFTVDRIIGEKQTVIKSLGEFYKDMKWFSGATILGDGRVAVILDVPELIKKFAINKVL